MPSFRKFNPAETAMSQHTLSDRALVAQQYDARAMSKSGSVCTNQR